MVVEEEVTDLDQKIIRQVEYYFGDFNYMRDKFLKEQSAKDDGWINLDVLLTFNRLKQLSEDAEVVVNALKKSSSGLLEISECGKKIRRSLEKGLPEATEEYQKLLNERTLHLKGFPSDSKYDDLYDFCKGFGTLESLQMRFDKMKNFKGCIFTVFANKEDAEKLLSQEVVFKDNKLLRENKTSYLARKKLYHEMKRNRKKSESEKDRNEDAEGNDNEKEKDAKVVKFRNAILKLKGLPRDMKFHVIKEAFTPHGQVVYVAEVNANQESFVRFGEEDGAKLVLDKVRIESGEGDEICKVKIGDVVVEAEVLTGEEELNYWVNYQNCRKSNFQRKDKFRRKSRSPRKRSNPGLKEESESKRIKSEVE